MGQTDTPRREKWSVSSFSGRGQEPEVEAGDGHKHGCLDAFTFAMVCYLHKEVGV